VFILKLGCYNVASAEEMEATMSALWWLIGTVLTVVSFALLVAGLKGRAGIVRIGKVAAPEKDEASKALPRSVNASNIVLGLVRILVGLAAVLVFAI
jgi:uncharacterized membrane protein